MMRSVIVLFLLISSFPLLIGQQKLDGAFDFLTEKSKKYSLYIPSQFKTGENAIVAFHPLNTARWNSKSWRDTLITFAEMNQTLLICPDGGQDGRIDDSIDTAFTTALLDSTQKWYSYNKNSLIALGFSWGGRTVYTYGLNHHGFFKGLIPIGAAIEGINLNEISKNSKEKNIFIVHGSADAVQTRYYPALTSLANKGSCLNDTLLSGVPHTIDFENRNQILSIAYQYVLNNNCFINSFEKITKPSLEFFPNPVSSFDCLFYSGSVQEILFTNISSGRSEYRRIHPGCNMLNLVSGVYILQASHDSIRKKLIIID